jgi:hypothetical protein
MKYPTNCSIYLYRICENLFRVSFKNSFNFAISPYLTAFDRFHVSLPSSSMQASTSKSVAGIHLAGRKGGEGARDEGPGALLQLVRTAELNLVE